MKLNFHIYFASMCLLGMANSVILDTSMLLNKCSIDNVSGLFYSVYNGLDHFDSEIISDQGKYHRTFKYFCITAHIPRFGT